MGKKIPPRDTELTFTPKINTTSRKLAAIRRTSGKIGDVPHFMLETESVSSSKGIEPFKYFKYRKLKRISPQQKSASQTASSISGFGKGMSTVPSENGFESEPENIHSDSERIFGSKKPNNHSSGRSVINGHPNKHTGTSSSQLTQDATFSFKPQLCPTSSKIVESMGSSFMSRQQKHLDKQKKNMEANLKFHFHSLSQSGKASPVTSPRSKLEVPMPESNSIMTLNNEESIAWGTPYPKTPEQLDTKKPESPATDKHDSLSSQSTPTLGTSMPNEANMNNKSSSTVHLHRLMEGPYPHGRNNMLLRRQKTTATNRGHKRHQTMPETLPAPDMSMSMKDHEDDIPEHIGHNRSKTLPLHMLNRQKNPRKLGIINLERLKNAKDLAEKAVKYRKIFTIQGPYASVRNILRERGWVEKFYKTTGPPKVNSRKKKRHSVGSDEDDDDDDGDGDDGDDDDDTPQESESKIPPWEEEDGIYGIMSRVVRNSQPTFVWSLRRDTIDFRFLRKEQIVNHYCKAGSFTTKVGLCINMRNVPWYENANPDHFFPRCYRLSHEDEKNTFIDDFRLTACMNILKWVQMRHEDVAALEEQMSETKITEGCTRPECTRSRPGSSSPNKCIHMDESPDIITEGEATEDSGSGSPSQKNKKKKGGYVPERTLDLAIQQIDRFLDEKSDKYLDTMTEPNDLSDDDWTQFLQWYYAVVHEEAVIPNIASRVSEVEALLNRLKHVAPQLELDGIKNVWIVKPGAKSRGRGIFCCDRLEDMTKLVSSSVVRKDSKFVVQKYIERPLLIYNTKFDIRQWFLVTDFNPLTFWFYKECYLRFCTQQYTLDNFDESIHLSNNAIQKNYDNQKGRPSELPSDNMWSSCEFIEYLKKNGKPTVWDDVVYPGMKKAIQCALAATQDIIEFRKNSFELYGADFMLTEDMQPWLIEINSSPSMCVSTRVTARLCPNVLEDTLKVVLDKRVDKNADIGMFELACRQPQVTVPPYIGIDLTVQGLGVKQPVEARRKAIIAKNNIAAAPAKSSDATHTDSNNSSPKPKSPLDTPVLRMAKAKKELKELTKSISERDDEKVNNKKSENTEDGETCPPPPPSSAEKVKVLPKKFNKKAMEYPTPVKFATAKTTQIVTTNPWHSNNCSKCGCGITLRLSTEMYNCQCRKDGIRVDMGEERVRPKTPRIIPANARPYGLTFAAGSGQSVNMYARNRVIQALVNSKDFDKKQGSRTTESLPHRLSDMSFSTRHLPRLNKRFTAGHKKSTRHHAGQKMFVVSNSYVT